MLMYLKCIIASFHLARSLDVPQVNSLIQDFKNAKISDDERHDIAIELVSIDGLSVENAFMEVAINPNTSQPA